MSRATIAADWPPLLEATFLASAGSKVLIWKRTPSEVPPRNRRALPIPSLDHAASGCRQELSGKFSSVLPCSEAPDPILSGFPCAHLWPPSFFPVSAIRKGLQPADRFPNPNRVL